MNLLQLASSCHGNLDASMSERLPLPALLVECACASSEAGWLSTCGVQANFEKYSSGGGFVSSELAAKIVSAGPHLENAGNIKQKRYSVEL